MASWRDRATRFFHWKYSGVLIPFLWGGALTMIGIGLATEPFDLAFFLAYFLFLIGGIYTLGFWLTSDFLEKKRKRTRPSRRRGKNVILYRAWRYGLSAAIILVIATSVFLAHEVFIARKLSLLSRFLVPANDKTSNVCGGPAAPNELTIFAGKFIARVGHFPATIVRVNGKNKLLIDKIDGRVAISVEIFSKDGKIVAAIEKNKFTINANNYFRKETPDESTLVLYDQSNNQVLNARFLNESEFRIGAALFYPDFGKIDLFDTFLQNLCVHAPNLLPSGSIVHFSN